MPVNSLHRCLVVVGIALSSLGCNDATCDVENSAWEPKIGPPLRPVLDEASEGSSLRVIFTATEPDGSECLNAAVVSNGGVVLEVLSGRSILAAVSPDAIRAVASRADVQSVDAELENTPPP